MFGKYLGRGPDLESGVTSAQATSFLREPKDANFIIHEESS